MHGRFISFEGIDGVGKSSNIKHVVDQIKRAGHTVITTREPGGTPVGEAIRQLVTQQAMSMECEALLMFAARQELVNTVIRPALGRGDWVVADRFTDATYAYQGGGRGLPAARIAALAEWVHDGLWPHLTLFFDAPPAVAAARLAAARGEKDKFEQEGVPFFERVRASYLERAKAEPSRFAVIDATQTMDAVEAQAAAAIQRQLLGTPA